MESEEEHSTGTEEATAVSDKADFETRQYLLNKCEPCDFIFVAFAVLKSH